MSSKRRWPSLRANADLLAEDEALTPAAAGRQVEAILRGTEQTRTYHCSRSVLRCRHR